MRKVERLEKEKQASERGMEVDVVRDWIDEDEMYSEANHNDETVPINQEQRKNQEGVADATKVKERKKYLETTANGVALQLSASKIHKLKKRLKISWQS